MGNFNFLIHKNTGLRVADGFYKNMENTRARAEHFHLSWIGAPRFQSLTCDEHPEIPTADCAVVVDPTEVQSEKVVFGATVTISDEDDQEVTYQIVGEDEIDIKKQKISWKSPMAKALLGKSLGDEVIVKKPSGDEVFLIESIKFI